MPTSRGLELIFVPIFGQKSNELESRYYMLLLISEYLGGEIGVNAQRLFILGLFWSTTGQAAVVTDGTLGPKGPLAGPNYAIGAELGRQVGGNPGIRVNLSLIGWTA
ncbi:hypothetical protein CCP4SC76_8230007 [Gammaproteobacteria bacterium]